MKSSPTLHSHHITKPQKPTLKPKLGKECVCPYARTKRPTKQKHDCLTAVAVAQLYKK